MPLHSARSGKPLSDLQGPLDARMALTLEEHHRDAYKGPFDVFLTEETSPCMRSSVESSFFSTCTQSSLNQQSFSPHFKQLDLRGGVVSDGDERA